MSEQRVKIFCVEEVVDVDVMTSSAYTAEFLHFLSSRNKFYKVVTLISW